MKTSVHGFSHWKHVSYRF